MEFFGKQIANKEPASDRSSNRNGLSEDAPTKKSKVGGESHFRKTLFETLAGQTPSSDGASGLASALGLTGFGGDDNQNAIELFEIPTDFLDLHELRRLIAKSDVPAELVQPLMTLLALAERFGSTLVPNLVGWYLVGRIGKNRLGRKEFLEATQRTAPSNPLDEDNRI